jgi:SSS family solute:Na+ symporter
MGLKGIVCAILFLAMIAGDGSALHSWGSIFVQDIIVPIRKTPLSPKHHMLLLRLAVTGVAIFGFTFSILYRQTDYILMFLAITGAVYIGGAGSVIIGGLYWKKGTAAAAWCAMLIGSGTALLGIILQQPSVWESLRSLVNWSGNHLSLLNGAVDLRQWAANMPPKFPLNGRWMSLIAMLSSLGSYVLVSLLTCRQNFNLERMLHRGKYAIEPKSGAAASAAKPQSIWTKLIGIDSNFTLGDRVISISLFSWKMFWVLLILGIAIWNLFSRWPTEWWINFWRFQAIYIPLVLGAITVVWILWGGIRDLRRLLVAIKAVHQNEKDDGVVVGHHNLDEDNAAKNIK